MTSLTRLLALLLLVAASGCTVAPLQRGAADASRDVERVAGQAPAWPASLAAAEAAAPTVPERLGREDALRLAFQLNPEIRRLYARLGLSHAQVQEAARIANPSLSLAWLDSSAAGAGDQTGRGIAASFSDLLLLPARRRLSEAEHRRVGSEVRAELLALAGEVDSAWYRAVGATQVAAMRVANAHAAELSAALAGRFHAAGNLRQLDLDLQQAAVARAGIEALRAATEAAEARSALAGLVGISTTGTWALDDRLPAPPESALATEGLIERALVQRPDLVAARQEVAILEDALGVTRRWRWLGSIEVGYEREREPDGERLRGPTLELELPLFDQGQARLTRAQAELLDARARLDALALAAANDIATGAAGLENARLVALRYRDALLPRLASSVERTQEDVNFMFKGPFELLLAKREQYEAWEGYFEAVRDYWVARATLRVASGGPLPGDGQPLVPVVGPAQVLPTGSDAGREPGHHHHHHREQP